MPEQSQLSKTSWTTQTESDKKIKEVEMVDGCQRGWRWWVFEVLGRRVNMIKKYYMKSSMNKYKYFKSVNF